MKKIIDVMMTVCLLFLMTYGLVGEDTHEWIGGGMFVLFILHHMLNRKWTANLRKGNYTATRTVQTLLAFLLLLTTLGSMISGIVLSRHVFTFLDISGFTSAARKVHMTCAYWGFVLMSLHLGLHWSMLMGRVRKTFIQHSTAWKWSSRTVALLIAGYGVYAFLKRDIGSYMMLQVHFVFFDYKEPLAFFMVDYIAVMGMFVFIGSIWQSRNKKLIG